MQDYGPGIDESLDLNSSAQRHLKIREMQPVAPASGNPGDRETRDKVVTRNNLPRRPERISSFNSERADLLASIQEKQKHIQSLRKN